MKQRLDILLVKKGLVPSREKARLAIRKGLVRVDGQVAGKASQKEDFTSMIELLDDPIGFVSRGGLKLEKALDHFEIDVRGLRALDIGASTGGFTDCLLKQGARLVYAVDVGTGQLAIPLQRDPRVRSIEGRHFRDLRLEELDGSPVDLIVADLSFVSLSRLFPYLDRWSHSNTIIIALLKPQFELENRVRLKGGIIRTETLRQQAIDSVRAAAEKNGFTFGTPLPTILSDPGKQNQEYLILLSKG